MVDEPFAPEPEIHWQFRRGVPKRGDSDCSHAVSRPQANGVAERFVRTVRSECLDWLLILNQHLERVVEVFVEHYNSYRPHRALALTPPHPTRPSVAPTSVWGEGRVLRRDRLGGVVHEYGLAA
jgi:putative transposase